MWVPNLINDIICLRLFLFINSSTLVFAQSFFYSSFFLLVYVCMEYLVFACMPQCMHPCIYVLYWSIYLSIYLSFHLSIYLIVSTKFSSYLSVHSPIIWGFLEMLFPELCDNSCLRWGPPYNSFILGSSLHMCKILMRSSLCVVFSLARTFLASLGRTAAAAAAAMHCCCHP